MFLTTAALPSVWGLPVIVLSAIVHIAFKSKIFAMSGGNDKKGYPFSVFCCLLPAVFYALNPDIGQMIQYLPAWAYFGFAVWKGLYNTNRTIFMTHFSFTGKLFFLMLLGIFWINSGRVGGAINGAVPYIVLYLLVGVCLMRILREEGKLSRNRNVTIILIMLLACAALAGMQAPQLIMSVFGFLYRNVIQWIIMGAIFLVGAIMLVIVRALFAFLGLFVKDGEFEVPIDMSGAATEVFGTDIEYLDRNIAWMEALGAVVLILLIALILFLIARRLIGVRTDVKKGMVYKEERENLDKRDRGRIGGLLRPKDPRQAVRWYYRKYLKDGATKHGIKRKLSDTSLHVLRSYDPYYPGDDASDLRDVYVMARYRRKKEIHKSQADAAAELWNKVKSVSAPKSAAERNRVR